MEDTSDLTQDAVEWQAISLESAKLACYSAGGGGGAFCGGGGGIDICGGGRGLTAICCGGGPGRQPGGGTPIPIGGGGSLDIITC